MTTLYLSSVETLQNWHNEPVYYASIETPQVALFTVKRSEAGSALIHPVGLVVGPCDVDQVRETVAWLGTNRAP